MSQLFRIECNKCGSCFHRSKIHPFRGLFTWKYVFRLEMRARKMLSTVLQAPLDMFYHQGTPWVIIKYFQLEPPIWRSKIWYLEIENYLYSYLAYPILKNLKKNLKLRCENFTEMSNFHLLNKILVTQFEFEWYFRYRFETKAAKHYLWLGMDMYNLI